MPKLGDPGSNASGPLRALIVGDSGSGKTGSLVSLVKAGYRLHVCDFDNNLASLTYQINKVCPDKLGNVDYMLFRDNVKIGAMGPEVVGGARAYINFSRALNKWEDGSNPQEAWGPQDILVVDSLTNAGIAAYNYAKGIAPNVKDPRQWYREAQQALDFIISTICGSSFGCHVLVLTHIDTRETPVGTKAFASTIGSALGPKIPRYFSTMLQYELKFKGPTATRVILTTPSRELPLKNPASEELLPEYPIETGLATIFDKLT